MAHKVNLEHAFATFDEPWSPRVVGNVNAMQIQVVKAKGEFVWHHHEEGAEAFLVLRGSLRIRFREHEVALAAGELLVIPPDIEHMPISDDGCELLLFEPRATRNTGSVSSDRTRDPQALAYMAPAPAAPGADAASE
jgi:mannose-6-phosphate isomerase-like protein (cupin superfamily)